MKLNCFDCIIQILFYLYRHKYTTMKRFAQEFSVCRQTIWKDISFLSQYAPIYTKIGWKAGVFIFDDYRNDLFLHLSRDEEELLKTILNKRTDEKEEFF